ncbi:sensor histidine kinase [Urechidicola croceus]|uniref:histidine kinase n=1 Tax=Urechidicola croceus TaxID=1850246 RepID=A0A1D8P5L1_9FLAO|nr:HAMP domain-containing sensor histidine kinase [Urechidicola croceus]AOW19878.1 ATP-binding protein [Urechidicola croceus]
MAYRKYKLALLLRVAILFLALLALAIAVSFLDFKNDLPIAVVVIVPIVSIILLSVTRLYKFAIRRFYEMDDFFESVKYRDFSRWFSEKSGPQDIRELHKGFNKVNETFKRINKEKETQHLYLQKILELVDTGIVAYNTESRRVLWINDSFKKILDIPSLKSIDFIKDRKPKMYADIFESNHVKGNTISIDRANSKLKVLISSSLFNIEEDTFKLIVLQNIDDTLNENEAQAWKKLLSVMTHEIMNSIAPISSLAETLQEKIKLSIENSEEQPLEINDLELSIESIRKRSEGLMKFAKTYRGLNKITTLNASKVKVGELFENISNLLRPSLDDKNVELYFKLNTSSLQIEIDSYLIEQVLINLILNALDAVKTIESPKIIIHAKKDINGQVTIKVVDNGMGIPDEIADKIFIPFFSTKKNGSGIGLPLCKQIMLLHKGKIQVNTIEGQGTAISLVF